MGALANAFALLANQQGKEASTIIALMSTEVKKIAEKKKKIAEEKKKAEAKKKQSSVKDGGREKERRGHGHGQKSLDGNVVDQRPNGHQHNLRSDDVVSGNCYGQGDGPADTSYWMAKGNNGDGQANQEHEAVNHHGNESQGKVCVRTVVLSKEELRERLLARENERKEEEARRKERLLAREAERQEQWLAREAELAREEERKARCLAREAEREEKRLAREEERKKEIEEKRKKEMAMKTLQEYEEEKAYMKQQAEKATLSVPETPAREAKLDNIHTKQKSKDETVKNDSNIKKYRKVHKTMSIEEFLKLPTEREGQDGPHRGKQDYALPDEDNTVKVKEGPAPDLSETSFPVLSKVTDIRKDDTY